MSKKGFIFSRITFYAPVFFILFLSSVNFASTPDTIRSLLKASYHLSQQFPDSSHGAVLKAMELSESIHNDTLLADSYLEMSYVKSESGNPSEATLYAFKSIYLYEKLQLPNGMAKGFCRVAWDKLETGNHDDVLDDLYKALDLAKQDVDSSVLSTVYHMLGAAYNWVNKYGLKKDIPAFRDSFIMWMDSAIYYDRKTIEIRRAINARGLSNSLNNLGMVLLRKARETQTNFDAVDSVYQEILKMRKANNDHPGISASYTNLSQLERYRGNYSKALEYAHMGRKMAESVDYPFQTRLNFSALSQIHEVMGNSDSALFYSKKYYKMQLEAVGENHKNAIKEMETRYEVSKKDATLNLQQQKLDLQQLYLWFAFAGIVIMVFASIMFFRLYKKNKKLSHRNELLMREQNHRIKNNLQIISGLLSLQANRTSDVNSKGIIESSHARVEAMSLIHKKLYGNSFSTIRLDEFIQELTNQTLISAGIKPTKKSISIIPLEVKADTATSFGLILNELLINSCKYAFSNLAKPELHISLETLTSGKLLLKYSDNGPGFDPTKEKEKKHSLGLKLIDLQVQQLQGNYEWIRNGSMIFKAFF